VRFLLWPVSLLCLLAGPVRAETAAVRQEKRLEAGKNSLEKLRNDPRRRRYRDGWEAIERELDQALRAAPSGPLASEAALWAGRARVERWQISRVPADARAAEAALRRVDILYEGSPQAAQALLADVQLSLRTHDTKEAAQASRRLVARYSHSAEARSAAALLVGDSKLRRLPIKAVAEVTKEQQAGPVPEKAQLPVELEDEDDSAAKPAPIGAGKTVPGAGAEKLAAPAHESAVDLQGSAGADEEAQSSEIIRQIVEAAGTAAGQAGTEASAASAMAMEGATAADTAQVPAAGAAHANRAPLSHAILEPSLEEEGPEVGLGAGPGREAHPRKRARAVPAPPPEAEEEDPSSATRARELRTLALSSAGGSVAAQLGLKVRKVVIDPGHGGKDTGAIGPHGVREKDVALAIARKVAARVRALGLAVVLTRDDDSFVSLDDRTRIANEAKADLFVSIHCNAARQRGLSGVETWTLNVGSDRYSARLAEFENAEADRNVSDLRLILADLATKANAGDARELAQAVQSSLVRGLALRVGRVRDHGIKQALFYVLLGAHMPSILVETAFISNPSEEARLKSARYQDGAAEAIARGVREFVDGRQRLARAP